MFLASRHKDLYLDVQILCGGKNSRSLTSNIRDTRHDIKDFKGNKEI